MLLQRGGIEMTIETQNKIAGYRKMLGLRQVDLAKTLDITVQAYSKKETGKTAFNDGEKVKLLNLFKVANNSLTIDSLFF